MSTLHTLFLTVLSAAAPLAAPLATTLAKPAPYLDIGITAESVEFQVFDSSEKFIGAVIASLSPELTHYVRGLPPLLTDFVLLDAGYGSAEQAFAVTLPRKWLPVGVPIHAQGIVLDGEGQRASEPASFELGKPSDG